MPWEEDCIDTKLDYLLKIKNAEKLRLFLSSDSFFKEYCNSDLDIVKEVLFDIVNPEKYSNEYPEPLCDNVDIAKAIYDSKWWKILFNNTDQYAYIYEPFITISIRT